MHHQNVLTYRRLLVTLHPVLVTRRHSTHPSPASTLSASTTMKPLTMALVVAMAWMMFPAMPRAPKLLCCGMA